MEYCRRTKNSLQAATTRRPLPTTINTAYTQLFDNATYTYTYLIGDRTSGQCALIDPVRELVDRDLKIMKQFDLKLKYSS